MFFMVSQFQTSIWGVDFSLYMVELVCHFFIGCLEINVVNISSVGAYR